MSSIYTIHSDSSYFSNIESLSKGRILSFAELNFCCTLFESYNHIQKPLMGWNKFENFEIDKSKLQQIDRKLIKKLRNFIEPSGNTFFERHPLLSKLYNDVSKLEKELRTTISYSAKQPLYSNILQYSEHDVVNDRFVLAVRSDSYFSDLGPIIAKSTSGMTLFVEPAHMRDKSNKRIQLLAQIEEVLNKLTIEFSNLFREFYNELIMVKECLLEVDIIFTKVKYSERFQFCRPTISNKYEIKLRNLYHPLLEDPIKNSVEISSSKDGFILSGPNTGGKTVTLKALTIAHLFLHMGLFIPATDAIMYPVEGIYYFSNDQQDLSEGLSSFASEARNYLHLLKNIERESLIVVDEIFNSTSSEEASALAISFLDEIHYKSNAKVVISTHHQLFKTFIHSNEKYVSAHVGYDLQENKPTYKVYTGEPGSSMAFTIFDSLSQKYQIPTGIPEKAKKILDKKHVSYEKLLQDLSNRKSELDKVLSDNTNLNKQLKNQKRSMEGLLLLEKEKIIKQYEKKINNILKDAEHIRRQAKNESVANRRFTIDLHEVKSQLNLSKDELVQRELIDHSHLQKIKIEQVQVGDKVFSTLLNKEVPVLAINMRKKEVQVQNKNVSLWCPIKSLMIAKKSLFSKLREKSTSQIAPKVHISIERTVSGKVELDCRGMRLDEFQRETEVGINELLCGDIPFLTIIHGHGNGVLKKWLRGYLRGFKELSFGPLDGNDGCTKIDLVN